jgi:chromosome segregation ATPase
MRGLRRRTKCAQPSQVQADNAVVGAERALAEAIEQAGQATPTPRLKPVEEAAPTPTVEPQSRQVLRVSDIDKTAGTSLDVRATDINDASSAMRQARNERRIGKESGDAAREQAGREAEAEARKVQREARKQANQVKMQIKDDILRNADDYRAAFKEEELQKGEPAIDEDTARERITEAQAKIADLAARLDEPMEEVIELRQELSKVLDPSSARAAFITGQINDALRTVRRLSEEIQFHLEAATIGFNQANLPEEIFIGDPVAMGS